MNSVFDRFRRPNVISMFRSIQQNPSQIGDMLLKSGKIDNEQYERIKSMNNPKDICEYLMQNNSDFQRMYNGR